MRQLYALPLENGTIAITELIADVQIEDEAKRMALPSPVILEGITPITEQEAAAIRAQRPKPQVQASATPVLPQVHTDILLIQQENDGLKQRMADLERQLADFPLRLAELISNAKAQEQ